MGSDHYPIMLVYGCFHQGRRPFRFENMWLKVDDFVELVKSWWDSYQVKGFPSFILANKLKALKSDLRRLNVEVFGNVIMKKNALMLELHGLDYEEENRSLSAEEKIRKEIVCADLEKMILMEEISLRQKSRVLWLKEGDKNSKFFHRIANSNRNRNSIGQLYVDGAVSTNQEAIQEHIVQFYEKLYMEDDYQCPFLDGLRFSVLSDEELEGLDQPFTEDEVLVVVKDFNGDKAPGPDGFNMAF